jgi:hypothetical protein
MPAVGTQMGAASGCGLRKNFFARSISSASQAQQMVTSAGDIQPSPQMRCVAIARIPFIDQAYKQVIRH